MQKASELCLEWRDTENLKSKILTFKIKKKTKQAACSAKQTQKLSSALADMQNKIYAIK